MKIAVLGATGRTGSLVLAEALSRGHQVTALARNPGVLGHSDVNAVEGDIGDLSALGRVFEGADAVISAIGARGRTSDLHTLLATNSVKAMTATGVKRFVGVSVGGLDVPGDQKGPRDRFIGFLARTSAGASSADREREYLAWQASALSWTLVRVPRLLDGETSIPATADPHIPPRKTVLHRSALAVLLLDCATTDRYVQQAPFAADS
ncbi:NAD(P)-dependent oxidoreductase [Arthrobacter sp. TMN-49]